MTNMICIWMFLTNSWIAGNPVVTWTQPANEPYYRTDGIVVVVPSNAYYDSNAPYGQRQWEDIKSYTIEHKLELGKTVTKPSFINKAEKAYTNLYKTVYQDTSYTNITREEAQSRFADIVSENPQMAMFSDMLTQSFNTIQKWWVSQGASEDFHPYPWGLDTFILYPDMTWKKEE